MVSDSEVRWSMTMWPSKLNRDRERVNVERFEALILHTPVRRAGTNWIAQILLPVPLFGAIGLIHVRPFPDLGASRCKCPRRRVDCRIRGSGDGGRVRCVVFTGGMALALVRLAKTLSAIRSGAVGQMLQKRLADRSGRDFGRVVGHTGAQPLRSLGAGRRPFPRRFRLLPNV